MKKLYLHKTAALILVLVFLLALAPPEALALEEDGANGLDLTAVAENKTYQCGGGSAEWTYSADTDAEPHKLALSGDGTITAAEGAAGIVLPPNAATEITVEGTWTITGGKGTSGILCSGTLALKLENGAALTTTGGPSTGDGFDENGVSAKDLTIDVASGCTLRAVAGQGTQGVGAEFSGAGIKGSSKLYPIKITNNGTIEAVSGGIKPQYGIVSAGGITLSGTGTTTAVGAQGINVQKRNFAGTDSQVGVQIDGGTLIALGKGYGIFTEGTNGETDILIADGV